MRKFTFSFKSLLVACLLMGGASSAWGDEVSTFNFSGQTNESTPTLSGANHHKAANAQQVQVAVDEVFGGKFAFQNVGAGTGFYYTTTQLVQFQGERYFSILELSAGDKIEITFSTADAGSVKDKHFTVENSGTLDNTNLSLSAGGSAIAANTDLESGTAYYVLADGYVDFKTRKNVYINKVVITKSNSSLPKLNRVWGQNFKSLGKEFQTEITTDGGTCSYGVAVTGDANFFYLSADGVNAFINRNIGVYVAYNSGGNHRRWKLYNGTNGLYNATNASNTIHIYNLTKGQVVKVSGSALPACGGVLTSLNEYDGTNTRYYQATAAGTGDLTIEKQKYIYSIEVFNLDAEIVGMLDKSTGFLADKKDFTLSKGQAINVSFINHGLNTQNFYNWIVRMNNTTTGWQTLRADNVVLEAGDVYTKSLTKNGSPMVDNDAFWSQFRTDMNDASVVMTVDYSLAGMLSVTATATAAGSGNVYVHSYAYNTAISGNVSVELGIEKAWLEILSSAQVVPVTVTEAGYATFSSEYNLDLTTANTPEGLTAYYIGSGLSKNNAPFTAINQTVAAGQGILLKGAADTYNIKVAASGTALSGNALVATNGNPIPAGNYVFAYETANPSTTAGFYYVSSATAAVPAGKAYLDGSKVPSSVKSFIFGDDTATGVEAPVAAEAEEDGVYYNLNGQQVTKDYKGIVIVNGKKFFNK